MKFKSVTVNIVTGQVEYEYEIIMYEVVIRQLPSGAEVNKQEITDEQYNDILAVLTGQV